MTKSMTYDDEPMTRFKGRLCMRQYLKCKPVKKEFNSGFGVTLELAIIYMNWICI